MKKIAIVLFVLLSFGLYAEDKFALVIGNSHYGENPLSNTINDANDVSNSFTGLGYNVTTVIDGNKQAMEVAVSEVSNSLTEDSMIVFYYAGHAAQVEKSNYLIPVNETINSQNDLKYKSVNVEWVLGSFKDSISKTNIIILDSCRDNPFKNTTRGGGTRGLSVVSAPRSSGATIRNTAIIYATTDGNTADDGDGRNSPFTESFLKHIKKTHESVIDVMTYVTQDVFTNSNGKQEPTIVNAFKEKVYFSKNQTKSLGISFDDSHFGAILVTADSDGEFYIDGKLVGAIIKGEKKNISNIPVGKYIAEYVSGGNREVQNIEIIDNMIFPISFKTSLFNNEQNKILAEVENNIEVLKNEKELLGIKRDNLEVDIKSLNSDMALHLKYSDARDSQKSTSVQSGWISFFSYAGAIGTGSLAYDSYNKYNSATLTADAAEYRGLTSGLLIVTSSTAIVGLVSNIISSFNNKKVKQYDLQESIFLGQIKQKNIELIRIKFDYENVLSKIVRIQKNDDRE